MDISKEQQAGMLENSAFPRSTKYDPQWVVENSMGPHPLWLMEWLCRDMNLEPGMRVLDMGCGKALTSIFLAKEFGVQVWANDLWIPATENWGRICAAGVQDRVFPIHAEARELPYADGFFDAAVSVDSYHYYGTDDLYLMYFAKFVRPGGRIGIVVPALMREFDGPVPHHLRQKQKTGGAFWTENCWSFHTMNWWRQFWGRTSLVDVELAETLKDGWRLWLQHEKAAAGNKSFPSYEEALEIDQGRYLGLVRMVARKGAESSEGGAP